MQFINNDSYDIIQFSIDVFNCLDKNQYYSIKRFFTNYNMTINGAENIAKAMFIEKKLLWNLCFKIYKATILKKAFSQIEKVNLTYAEDAYCNFVTLYYANSYKSYKSRALYLYRINSGVSTKIRYDLQSFSKYLDSTLIISYIYNFLQHNNACLNWYTYLNAFKDDIFYTITNIMAETPQNSFQQSFNLFYKKNKIIKFLPYLEKCFISKQNKLASAYANVMLPIDKSVQGINYLSTSTPLPASSTQKTMGIFYHRYYKWWSRTRNFITNTIIYQTWL